MSQVESMNKIGQLVSNKIGLFSVQVTVLLRLSMNIQTRNDQRVKQTKRSTIDNLSTLHFQWQRESGFHSHCLTLQKISEWLVWVGHFQSRRIHIQMR